MSSPFCFSCGLFSTLGNILQMEVTQLLNAHCSGQCHMEITVLGCGEINHQEGQDGLASTEQLTWEREVCA